MASASAPVLIGGLIDCVAQLIRIAEELLQYNPIEFLRGLLNEIMCIKHSVQCWVHTKHSTNTLSISYCTSQTPIPTLVLQQFLLTALIMLHCN